MKRIWIVLLALLLLTGCGEAISYEKPVEEQPVESLPPQEEEAPSQEELLGEIVEGMSIEEKIGQLIMAGIDGTEISDRERSLLNDYRIGGFILFARNISDEEGTRDLLDSLKEANSEHSIPLFLAVDEEGGVVTRLSGIYGNLPPQSRLGESGDPELAYKYGSIQGEKLKRLGLNVNFSPVLDVNSNPDNPVIGNRSLSEEPELVAQLGIQVSKGIADQGIVPVGKHYPGHGDTDVDSHTLLPVIEKSKEELLEMELLPFQRAIDEGLPAIMVGHLLVASLDEKPASLSKPIIEGLLREEQGFGGVVFSDDLTMGAITNSMNASDAAVEFIVAGGDVALICHGEDQVVETFDSMMSAWERGYLVEDEINDKVIRILKLKEYFKLEDIPVKRIYEDEIDWRIDELFN
ncbi:beta-N-acetylhexosaminidase [Gudongella sp. DL1XJH-153]|uniref:beta-N-acetylhexosaminidase n=1 Tax=Gudongella sp. DL1XJH-153 TaxID=3409804 RepID=UPI003BB6C6E4